MIALQVTVNVTFIATYDCEPSVLRASRYRLVCPSQRLCNLHPLHLADHSPATIVDSRKSCRGMHTTFIMYP
ncbi:hypothetical protein PLICRDRAFT_633484 [Plicaturopsis crispa FD-325 SS-3]|nr:hypothetical protein PLICRDRAFT_633484 [Plicaturopsis crispa FD-325 SS-3]